MNPHLTCQAATESGNMPFNLQYTVPYRLFVYWHTLSNFPCCEWVTESDRKWETLQAFLFLFQIHSRETLTKSISLPRSAYWQHITRQNSVGDLYSYQGTGMKLLIIIHAVLLFPYLPVSVVLCGAHWMSWRKDRWRNRKTHREKISYVALEEFHKHTVTLHKYVTSFLYLYSVFGCNGW